MKNKINNFPKLILIIGGFIILFNCCTNKKIVGTLEGDWVIDTIFYRNISPEIYYNMKSCMGANVVYFKKKSKFEVLDLLPSCEDEFTWSNTGKWTLIRSGEERPYHLLIESENEVFNGSHQLWFYKDEKKKVLKMVLFSDKLYLTAGKGWLSYDHNTELINDLIKATEKREGNVDNVP